MLTSSLQKSTRFSKIAKLSLSPGEKIGRYEIKSLLGAGGMGEVYRAFDTQLEREVALKFLTQTNDAEKLRRFRQEAKVVTALNHPNILIIYDFGEFEDSHFIVSEIVNGKSLRAIINEQNSSLGEILEIIIQVGNALSAAHKVGIIHRDIKPENIMVLPDGYVKVLDFGLAKFVNLEEPLPYDSNAPTASLIHTQAGAIIGTVNYMPPEQLRGKIVDQRMDIWSSGIVLFEMLAGRRPFLGDSFNDIIAAIIERPLPKISEINENIPPEIENIVAKALAKNLDERFPSAPEFVSELKTAKLLIESGTFKALQLDSIQSGKPLSTGETLSEKTAKLSGIFVAGKNINWFGITLLTLLIGLPLSIAGGIFIFSKFFRQTPAKQLKVQRLTTTGNVTDATISPDGRFIGYVKTTNGQQSLWLRQVAETDGRELIPANSESYNGLTFTPDGNWIYYTIFDRNGSGKLRRITLLGGAQQEITKDIDSVVAFAPDGQKLAFVRSNPTEGVDRIILMNADGTDERVLSLRTRPEFYLRSARESLAWSPNGKFIACPFGGVDADGEFMSVSEVSIEDGQEKPLTDTKWHRVGRVVWTKNADEILITAADVGSESFQIRRLSHLDGEVENVTSQLNDYYNLSVNKDSTLLLAVAYDKTSNLLVAEREKPNQTKQIAGGNYDGIGGVSWTADEHLVYVSMESGNRDIWTMDEDGANRRQLTFDKAADDSPTVSSDGKYIVFVSARTSVSHLWRMNANGSELKQLTDGGGESSPVITPDGKNVIYSSRTGSSPLLWKISIEGGASVQLTKELSNWSAMSADGKRLAFVTRGNLLESKMQLAVADAETGNLQKKFDPSGMISAPNFPAVIRWLPDSQGVVYTAEINGVSNLWKQSVANGEPKKITDFTTDKIFSFDLSSDGGKIVYARGALRNDLVLMENF